MCGIRRSLQRGQDLILLSLLEQLLEMEQRVVLRTIDQRIQPQHGSFRRQIESCETNPEILK